MVAYYEKGYKKKYGTAPSNMNRFAGRYGFEAVLGDMNMEDARQLVDYYFLTQSPNKHALDWFFWNYHKLLKAKNEHKEDAVRREELRRASKERASKWRERRLGNKRTTSN